MGTNYYATKTERIAAEGSTNGLLKTVTVETRMHIGKSSGGNAFMLHIYPKEGIIDTQSMMDVLNKPGWEIVDENGREFFANDFFNICVWRDAPVNRDTQYRDGWDDVSDHYESNFS